MPIIVIMRALNFATSWVWIIERLLSSVKTSKAFRFRSCKEVKRVSMKNSKRKRMRSPLSTYQCSAKWEWRKMGQLWTCWIELAGRPLVIVSTSPAQTEFRRWRGRLQSAMISNSTLVHLVPLYSSATTQANLQLHQWSFRGREPLSQVSKHSKLCRFAITETINWIIGSRNLPQNITGTKCTRFYKQSKIASKQFNSKQQVHQVS